MAAVPEVSAFAMTEAVGRRNVRQALARLEDLFINREPPLKIIGLLAFKVRQWWQVRQIIDRRGSEAENGGGVKRKRRTWGYGVSGDKTKSGIFAGKSQTILVDIGGGKCFCSFWRRSANLSGKGAH